MEDCLEEHYECLVISEVGLFSRRGVGVCFTGLLCMIRGFNAGKMVCFRKYTCKYCPRNLEFGIWLEDSMSLILIIVAVCFIDKLIYIYSFQALRFPIREHGIFIFSSAFCTTEFLRWAVFLLVSILVAKSVPLRIVYLYLYLSR